MANIEIPDEQLKQIVAEVEKELETMFKSEQLMKAEEKKEEKKEEAPAPKEEDKSAPAAAPEAPAPAPAAAIEAAPEMAPEAEMAPPAPEMAPHIEPDGDEAGMGGVPELEALKLEYASLPPEELRMHVEAAMQALLGCLGGHGEADPVMPPEVPNLPAPVPAGVPGMQPAMKMELEAIAPNKKAGPGEDHLVPSQPSKKFGAGEDHLEAVYVKAKKSEDDLALKIKEVEELKKSQEKTEASLSQLTSAFKMYLEKPERKAVTSIAAIDKPGTQVEAPKLSKSEVMDKLKVITQEADLKKSDREMINAYCVGSIGVDKIAHLLK